MNDYMKGLLVAFLRQNLTPDQCEVLRNHYPELSELIEMPPGMFQKEPPAWLREDLATLCSAGMRIQALKNLRQWGLNFGRDSQGNAVHDLGRLIGAKRWLDKHFPSPATY